METRGDVLAVTNEEAKAAADLFCRLEGSDIEPAAGVTTASLIQAVKEGKVSKNSVIMLNITGGGVQRFRNENRLVYKDPDYIFPIDAEPDLIKKVITDLF